MRLEVETLQQSWSLYKERSDVELSFTDCTTATLAKRHGITTIFTYDQEHLGALGLQPLPQL